MTSGHTLLDSSPPLVKDVKTYPQGSDKPTLMLSVGGAVEFAGSAIFGHDLDVYAQDVFIDKDWSRDTVDADKNHLANRRLGIFANRIELPPSSVPATIRLTVSAAGKLGDIPPPDSSSNDPKAGGPGGAGGVLDVYVESMTDDVASHLRYSVAGGKGADGQSTAFGDVGGAGGDGGAGGTLTIIWDGPIGSLLKTTSQAYKMLGTLPGDSIDVNSRNALDTIAIQLDHGDFDLDTAARLATYSEKLKALTSGAFPLKAVCMDVVQHLGEYVAGQVETISSTLRHQTNTSAGEYGLGGQGISRRGESGSPGKDGSGDIVSRQDLNAIRSSNVVFAHPDQCRMLLERAKTSYYIGDLKAAIADLQCLQNRLAFVELVKPDDPITKAYQASAQRLYMMGSPPSAISSNLSKGPAVLPASLVSLKGILGEANRLINNILGGYDFYGNPPLWVPLKNVDSACGASDKLLGYLKQIEEDYKDYVEATGKSAADILKLHATGNTCSNAIDKANGTIDTLTGQLTQGGRRIGILTNGLKPALDKLLGRIEAVEDKIKDSFDVPFGDIVNAMTQVMFCEGAGMSALQSVSVAFDATKTLPDDNGKDKIDKTLLITSIDQIVGTGDDGGVTGSDLVEGFKKTGKPGFELTDPGAAKLMVAQSKLEQLLSHYSNILGRKQLNELNTTFRNYVGLVLARNSAVTEYNVAVGFWLQAQIDIEYYTTTQHTVADQGEELASYAEYPAMQLFMERMYRNALADVAKALYTAQSAYLFRSLDAKKPVSESMGGYPLSELNFDVLNGAQEALFAAKQDLPAPYQGSDVPIKYHLDDLQRLTLQVQGSCAVTMIAPDSSTDSDTSPFAGHSEVRYTSVFFYCKGPVTTARTLAVHIEHTGTEDIVNGKDQRRTFTHEAIPTLCTFNIDTLLPETPLTERCQHLHDASDRALVGPFTTWQIDIPKSLNSGLDLSAEIAEAWFAFNVRFVPF